MDKANKINNARSNKNETPTEWKQGVITLLFKSGCAKSIRNYRPITLLNSIYKIWATVITNRLKPIMNILTNETQHGYKIKKSTVDIIYHIKRNFIKTT